MSGHEMVLHTQGHEGAGDSETRANERGCRDGARDWWSLHGELMSGDGRRNACGPTDETKPDSP
jgi:hypothetical protein